LILIGGVIAAPIGEELVFRGYLMNLWRARWGVVPAVLVSSLAFGLFHWERAVFAAPMGVIFAMVYLKYNSLWPAIWLHASYNLLAFPWLVGGLFYVKEKASIAHLSNWIPELLLGLLFIPLCVLFWRQFKPGPTG
jgi:CAAX protease family protein